MRYSSAISSRKQHEVGTPITVFAKIHHCRVQLPQYSIVVLFFTSEGRDTKSMLVEFELRA